MTYVMRYILQADSAFSSTLHITITVNYFFQVTDLLEATKSIF